MPENDIETVETPETSAPAPEPVIDALDDAPNLTAEDVFNFDPFDPATGTPNVPESEVMGESVEVAPESVPGSSVPPEPEGAGVVGTPVSPPVPQVPSIEDRYRQLEEQNRMLMELVTRSQTPAPAPAQAPAPPKEPEYPNYMFQVPPQIREMLTSEDPAQQTQGLAALIAGMGRTVHEHVRKEYQEILDSRIRGFREQFISDQQRAEQARGVFQDFYGTYPHLNRPELRGVIESATRAVVAEEKATTWSASLRDKIGQRVLSIIQEVGQVGAPRAETGGAPATPPPNQAVGNGAAPRRPAPPRMRGTSARPTPESPPQPGSQEAHMLEVLHGSRN